MSLITLFERRHYTDQRRQVFIAGWLGHCVGIYQLHQPDERPLLSYFTEPTRRRTFMV